MFEFYTTLFDRVSSDLSACAVKTETYILCDFTKNTLMIYYSHKW